MRKTNLLALIPVALALVGLAGAMPPEGAPFGVMQPLLPRLSDTPTVTATTVPDNGDVNPYGVAFVPRGFQGGGTLHPGDILVSNFNNASNSQGTGTTIVRIDSAGNTSVFFGGESNLGLTTALGILEGGFVIVGDVPTTDGTFNTIQAGKLLVLDADGQVSSEIEDPDLLNGPWDLTIVDEVDRAQVFVSNVLDGTVTRLDLRVVDQKGAGRTVVVHDKVRIASGYLHRSDPAALVVGPTGLAFDRARDLLFVASTGDNAIFSIANPLHTRSDNGMGRLVYTDDVHLHGPLGLVLAPNGHLLATEGDAVNPDPDHPSEITEFTRDGQFVAEHSVDLGGSGGAFGLAIEHMGGEIHLAAVDDVANTLEVWVVKRAGRTPAADAPRRLSQAAPLR